MKVFIDIGHPAHVHYFKNISRQLQIKNNQVLFIARNRDVIFRLLDVYNLNYVSKGKGSRHFIGKIFYFLKSIACIVYYANKHKADLLISHGGMYCPLVGWLLKIPTITTEDTEHASVSHKISRFPNNFYFTPFNFAKNLGHNHFRVNSVMEWLYLSPKYFSPSIDIVKTLKLKEGESYVILRFISWDAYHDLGHKSIDIKMKRHLIELLERKYKVFISNEGKLPEEFEKYKLPAPPEYIHEVLMSAKIFISESGTMSSEAALLGTPTIYINSLPLMCYLNLAKDNGILEYFSTTNNLLEYIEKLLLDENIKNNTILKKDKMVKQFIDFNKLLVWFIENYPLSISILRKDPDFQQRF
ncbi:MAG: DUF354 domain-containing protein [Candidatus Odinarchaeota archaeon]